MRIQTAPFNSATTDTAPRRGKVSPLVASPKASRPSALMSAVALLLAAMPLCGCSGSPPPLLPPSLPSDAGQLAVKQLDSNGDGIVAADELSKSPALKSAISRIDANRDGQITAEEVNARIRVWRDSQLGIMPLLVTVRQRGQPLATAQVTIVPEPFLGQTIKSAQGTTNDRGTAILRISNEADERGVHLGFYRVEISKKDASGRETIAAQYNTQSEIGLEAAMDDPSLEHVKLNLAAH